MAAANASSVKKSTVRVHSTPRSPPPQTRQPLRRQLSSAGSTGPGRLAVVRTVPSLAKAGTGSTSTSAQCSTLHSAPSRGQGLPCIHRRRTG